MLLKDGCVTEKQIVVAKSAIWNLPICDVDRFELSPKVMGCIPREKMLEYCCIPITYDDYDPSVLLVVTDDLMDPKKAEELQSIVNSKILILFGTRTAILNKIEECYPAPKKEGAKATEGVLTAGGTEKIHPDKLCTCGRP